MSICEHNCCTGCAACANICPKGCITMTPDGEGFLRPVIDETICIDCGRCRMVCPVLREVPAPTEDTVAYAAIHQNEQVRYHSTSGGIFSLLGQWVLDQKGAVFGAAYDESFEVVHFKVENPEDLSALRGAKYAQSRLGDTYREAQKALQTGRYVLFSGTPCQIGGLKAFLGKEYEKLILVDLICHGVPSPKVWQHYVRYRSQQDACGEAPCAVNLRSKETGWPGYSIRFDYPTGESYCATHGQDPYLRGFVGDLYLRPSCHDCRFKGVSRQSDFTLADYWGVWDQHPELHDGNGTSLVLLHSEKARKIWETLRPQMTQTPADISAALTQNASALVSSSLTDRRDAFFSRWEQEDFSQLVDTLCPKPIHKSPSLFRRVLGKAKRFLKRIFC